MASDRSAFLFGQQSKPIVTYGRRASKGVARDRDLATGTAQSNGDGILFNTPLPLRNRACPRKLFRSSSTPVQPSYSDLPPPEQAAQRIERDCDVDLDTVDDLASIQHREDPDHGKKQPEATRATRGSYAHVYDFPTSPVAQTPSNKSSKAARKLQSSSSTHRVQQSSADIECLEDEDEQEAGLKDARAVIQTPKTSNKGQSSKNQDFETEPVSGPPLPRRRGLIFNKTPLRGYKQIRYPTDVSTHTFSSTYPTGDSFSSAEAPTSRGPWGKKRKQLWASPGVGMLDLDQDQTGGQSQPQKRQRRSPPEVSSSTRQPHRETGKQMTKEPEKAVLLPDLRNAGFQLRKRSTTMDEDQGKTVDENPGSSSQKHRVSPEKIAADLRAEIMPTEFQSKMDEVTRSRASASQDAHDRISITGVLAGVLAVNNDQNHGQPESEEPKENKSNETDRIRSKASSSEGLLQGDVSPRDANTADGSAQPAARSPTEEGTDTPDGISMVEVFNKGSDTCPLDLSGQGQSDEVDLLSCDAGSAQVNLSPSKNDEATQHHSDQETFILEPKSSERHEPDLQPVAAQAGAETAKSPSPGVGGH